MANIQSAKKRARQNIKRRQHNTSLRSRANTLIKKARYALQGGADKEKLVALTQTAMKEADKAASKGLFAKNKAARLKKRLNASLKKAVGAKA